MVALDRVSKTYSRGVRQRSTDTQALTDVSFTVNQGEFVFLVGASGSGKSTVMRLLTCEARADDGGVHVAGLDLAKLPDRKVAKLRRRVGTVYQDYKLLDDKTVAGNIAFALEVLGKRPKVIRDRVPKVLKLVELEDKADAYPHELSGGQQQRVSVARALVNAPRLLLCDEPTGNLDPRSSANIVRLLSKINEKAGTTIVMATHDMQIVKALSRRVVRLEGGRVVSDRRAAEDGEAAVQEGA